jgi:subtilisin-like proprotein convertase family protein
MSSGTKWLGSLLIAVTALASTAALAAVPGKTTVEGALISTGGGPVADGDYAVTFSLYKDAVGGAAVWSEGPVTIAVASGSFTYLLGSATVLSQAALASLGSSGYLALKVGTDPELARKPVTSVLYAMRSSVAESLDCSGCIGAGQVDAAVLAPFAKTADLATVATSGKYADLEGGPDLSAYVKASALATAAFSGAYSDLTGVPDLSKYLVAADLADVAKTGAYADLSGAPALSKVATSGSYADLSNPPTLAVLNKSCGTGLVVKGLKADGTYECVAAMDPTAFPPDAIDEVSNGLIANQFVDSVAGKTGIAIPDNNPIGVSDVIDFPDIGVAQKIGISVNLTNSKINFLVVSLIDPAGTEYVLHSKSGSGTALKTTYPDPTKNVSGDLTTWIGKNPKGKWYLKVVDGDYLNNTTDGAVASWSIDLQTLSSKKIQIKGDQYVTGSSYVTGNSTITGNLTVTGAVSGPGFGSPFPVGSRPFLYAKYIDSTANNWNYSLRGIPAYGADFGVTNASLHEWGFDSIVYGDATGNIFKAEGGTTYNAQNGTWQALGAFIKNTTAAPINMTVWYDYATSNDFGDYTGIAINGSNIWTTSGDTLGQNATTLTFPANQTSVVVLKSGWYYWTCQGCYYNYLGRSNVGFYNSSFGGSNMPAGLQWDYDRYNAWLANK